MLLVPVKVFLEIYVNGFAEFCKLKSRNILIHFVF